MNDIDITKEVESLVKKAAEADKALDAVQFSQAAGNAANAMATIRAIAQWPDEDRRPA